MDFIERVSEFGMHSIPVHREMSDTSHWSCANSQLKTIHKQRGKKIYSPFARNRGMGKHRGDPQNQEAKSICLIYTLPQQS